MWKTPVSPGFARIFCPRPLCDNLWQKFLTNVDNFFSPQKIIHFSPKCGGKMSWLVEGSLSEKEPRRVSPSAEGGTNFDS
jgi:hypothetical protein